MTVLYVKDEDKGQEEYPMAGTNVKNRAWVIWILSIRTSSRD